MSRPPTGRIQPFSHWVQNHAIVLIVREFAGEHWAPAEIAMMEHFEPGELARES